MKRNLRIGRIELNLTGISVDTARSCIDDFDQELTSQVSSSLHVEKMPAGMIERLDLGSFRVEHNITATDLRKTIANRILSHIMAENL